MAELKGGGFFVSKQIHVIPQSFAELREMTRAIAKLPNKQQPAYSARLTEILDGFERDATIIHNKSVDALRKSDDTPPGALHAAPATKILGRLKRELTALQMKSGDALHDLAADIDAARQSASPRLSPEDQVIERLAREKSAAGWGLRNIALATGSDVPRVQRLLKGAQIRLNPLPGNAVPADIKQRLIDAVKAEPSVASHVLAQRIHSNDPRFPLYLLRTDRAIIDIQNAMTDARSNRRSFGHRKHG